MTAAALSHHVWQRGVSLLFALSLLFVAACGATRGQANAGNALPLHGAFPLPPLPKPDVTLTDTSGQPFNLLQQTQGYLTLVYFGYTHCPDVCPAQMARFGTVVKALPTDVSQRLKVVFITTDPDRDTPPVIRAWLDHFAVSFIGLTGDQATIDQAEAAVGLPPAGKEDDGSGGYTVNHAAFVLAYTTDNIAHVVYPDGVSLAGIEQDLTQLARKGWSAAVPPHRPTLAVTP